MDMTKTVSSGPDDVRYFNVDNTFALFIKEENKDVPYFALKVDNITKYQQQRFKIKSNYDIIFCKEMK